MRVTLEIKSGPFVGKKLELKDGQDMTIGRAERADFSIPHDSRLSGTHFAMALSGTTCRLVDRKSTNGTTVNGSRVTEAVLRDGDQILAGNTVFLVQILQTEQSPAISASSTASPKNPTSAQKALGAPLDVGSWSFQSVPDGWEIVEGAGMRCSGKDIFPSNVIASEDQLPDETTLAQYIDSQMNLLRLFLTDPEFEIAGQAIVAGAEESTILVIRHKTDNGMRAIQRQVYARSGKLAGILTFTTLESEFPRVQSAFDLILSKAILQPE
jgi:pSer/pThr/pTyr-binding forkhead associated (FHA) protein